MHKDVHLLKDIVSLSEATSRYKTVQIFKSSHAKDGIIKITQEILFHEEIHYVLVFKKNPLK